MPKLNPPHLETKLPAFYIDGSKSIKIPFNLNSSTGVADIGAVYVIIKTVQTGIEVYSGSYPISTQASKDALAAGEVTFAGIPDNTFIPGQYYKVQLAFGDKTSPNPIIGYYSSVGIMKCTAKPDIIIEGLTQVENGSRYSYTGAYSNTDSNEKVATYSFDIYDVNKQLYESSGELLHSAENNTDITNSHDVWTPTKSLIPGELYTLIYSVTTVNGLKDKTIEYQIRDSQLIAPPTWFDGQLYATLYPDDAYIELNLYGNYLYGNFVLSRSSSKDNFASWNRITEFTIALENAATKGVTLWRDFTIEQGVEYLYAIQMKNDNNIYSIYMVNQGHKIVADFEDMFLYDGKRQLKIRFNPKVTSFKNTILETKTDTIGNKFPYFFRNGSVSYKEFPISGLISMLMDDNELFVTDLSPLPAARERTPSPEITAAPGRTQLTTENMRQERDFKLSVLEWLQNGELKMFKSPGEGNYIVRLLNISASPNDTLGRMIHTFTCTAYESLENSFVNLREYGYLNVEPSFTIDRMHFSATTHVNNAPYNGIQVLGDEVWSQNNLYMYNITLRNLAPYASIVFFNTKSSTPVSRNANEYGELKLLAGEKFKAFRFAANDSVSKQLVTIDFDYVYSLSSSNEWKAFNKYKTVTVSNTPRNMKNLFTTITDTYLDTSDNTYDYLEYLNANYGQVGEVIYVYIRKRKNLSSSEAANLHYNWSIKSFNKELEPIVAGGGRVFRDCGMLSELKCGSGFDVDIVYIQKEVGI